MYVCCAPVSQAAIGHSMFDSLRFDRTTQFVVCPLLSFWDFRNIKKIDEFMEITALLVDEQVTRSFFYHH